MKPDIDIIVKDLLAQNPDLEIEAGVLRVLGSFFIIVVEKNVSAFSRTKPS